MHTAATENITTAMISPLSVVLCELKLFSSSENLHLCHFGQPATAHRLWAVMISVIFLEDLMRLSTMALYQVRSMDYPTSAWGQVSPTAVCGLRTTGKMN